MTSSTSVRTIPTTWGTFVCYPDDIVGCALEEGRFWDVHLRPYMDEPSQQPRMYQRVAIDIGAYIGFHTCYLAAQYDRVVAFEPVPRTVQLLCTNLKANRASDYVWVVPLGAYDRYTLLRRARQEEVGWDPALSQHAPSVPWFPGYGGETISVAPADYFILDTDWVQFVKIDAQGCDLKALRGLEHTITRCRPLIVLEWEADYARQHGDTWRDVELWAEAHSYSIQRITMDFWDYVLRPLT